MPEIQVDGTTIHYDCQGEGDPLILIPFLTADHACFAFQLPAYAEYFRCYAIDLRGSGASALGDGACAIPGFAEDVVAFMDAMGIDAAHIAGYSLGGAVAMQLAAVHPQRTQSLSLHSAWPRTDAYLRAVVESWQSAARASRDVCETAIGTILPWCFTPETYDMRPEFIEGVASFIRSRPSQSLADFIAHSNAVIGHDALSLLDRITAPTQITFGARDAVTSTRFAEPMLRAIPQAELEIFDNCSHAAFFEDAEAFNSRTLPFLMRHRRNDGPEMDPPALVMQS